MNIRKTLTIIAGFSLLTGCSFSISSPPATPPLTPTALATILPTEIFTETPVSVQTTALPTSQVFAALPTLTFTSSPPGTPNPCTDPQMTALIDSLKSAVLTSDGILLSSIVGPQRGLDVAYFRDGNVINYRPDQAKFLFETTFEVNWGVEPGSGAEKIGSFHDTIVPELVKAFNQPYTLYFNELKHGGATYEPEWPYQGDFYSVYFPGTEANGFLDWHTWAVGVECVNNKPYVYALMPFFWEP
jgi:hypothetical protein